MRRAKNISEGLSPATNELNKRRIDTQKNELPDFAGLKIPPHHADGIRLRRNRGEALENVSKTVSAVVSGKVLAATGRMPDDKEI